MERVPGSEEGLGNAVLGAARRAVSAEELYALAKSKRYTHSRVRRLALCAALGYDRSLPDLPPYLHLLGASERGLALLKLSLIHICARSLKLCARLGRGGFCVGSK